MEQTEEPPPVPSPAAATATAASSASAAKGEGEEPESTVPPANNNTTTSSNSSMTAAGQHEEALLPEDLQQQQQQQQRDLQQELQPPEVAIERSNNNNSNDGDDVVDRAAGPSSVHQLPAGLELEPCDHGEEEGLAAEAEEGMLLAMSTRRGGGENGEGEFQDDGLPPSSSRRCCCCCSFRAGYACMCSRVKSSLCWSASTPILATFLIPLLAVVTHVIFYYGQTAPMWRLVYSAHVDVWANATSFEARSVFYTLGLDRDLHYGIDRDETVRTFTYGFAINELWVAAGMPGKLLPRIAAVLLVIFSGVWPHLKLVLLSLTWMFSVNAKRRTRVLHWLSTLGKWSLADVLVVCVMLGVLHMDWDVNPTSIKEGIVEQVPLLLTLMGNLYSANDVCTYLLEKNCTAPPSTFDWSKCASCRKFVSTAMDHPDASQATFRSIAGGVSESGSGFATLRVEGENGIYGFCIAVVLSIVLSLAVDVFDHRARRAEERRSLHHQDDHPEQDVFGGRADMLMEPLLLEEEGRSGPPPPPSPSRRPQRRRQQPQERRAPTSGCRRMIMLATALITTCIVYAAIETESLGRRVTGAGPKLLHDILGIAFNRTFSLRTLAETTGEAGGWDKLLMGTFALFLVFGPALRAVLCVIALMLPATPSGHRRRFLTTIDFLGAFCAWEVIALAAYLVSLLIPSTTSTIINLPECAVVSPETGQCLTVFFDPNDYFALVIVGGVVLIVVAQLPNMIVPKRQRRR